MDNWKKLRFRLYLKLEVDVWLEMYPKIYYKAYISFVCERFEKFLIFSITFVFVHDFSLIEIYGELSAMSKEVWMSEKGYSFNNIWR